MADIPIGTGKRAAYKAAEVCEIAHIQPYVLRSWESEFPRLGVVRSGTRIYRQADLEQVLRIKQLVFEEGLTLAGARRRIEEDTEPQPELPLEEFITPEIRQRIGRVRQGLEDLLGLLGGQPAAGRIADAQQIEDAAHARKHVAAAGARVASMSPENSKSPDKRRNGATRDKAKARPSRRHAGRV